ncbi:transporter substrate-binding domain-containing protein [Porifericola rhodea]|uniref:transporter substrate-binding domain-containing protein n=1 Tax=Porifericola rhodea TaxID=930972 RepID=UPI0026671FAB|nr:transporter substrate-binding domain-containing protein [Porifericola rhodea]WKN31642.1 transporter substrate-binding domain-containing protein [Porifericola rhodea]
MKSQYLCLLAYILIFPTLLSCSSSSDEKGEQTPYLETSYSDPVHVDLDKIKERGKLIAISSYSPTSYFIYRGQPMGYEYELLKRLANYLELDLEIKIAYNLDNFIEMLNTGEGDLVAHSLSITKPRKKFVDFTEHYTVTRQVLVQRKPENWRKMKLHEIDKQLIRDPLELIGKTVHVRKNSSYYRRLINLSQEMGGDIIVEPLDGNLETSEIIKMVNNGEIEYTIADEDIARINQTYYRDLDVATAVSFPQRLAWMVRKTSPKLKAKVNQWLAEEKKGSDFYAIYNKYYKNQKRFRTRVSSEYFSLTGGKISEYDEAIQSSAAALGWDWKLLASQIYQESRFEPETESWAGAKGLMQLMPSTAKEIGDYNLYDAEESIKAGVKYLQKMSKYYRDIPDSVERIKFVLATYNAGPGHIRDARRLAEKYGKNPDVWTENVEDFILLKSQKKYYSDPVVSNGYCRGEEPYNYVNDIFKRYQVYQDLLETKAADEEAVALQKP